MKITRIIFKMSAVTTIGFGGWILGKYSEQKRHLNVAKEDDGLCIFSNTPVKKMPGLPLFGTVSAATAIVPTETEIDMGSKLSATGKRVSEVSLYFCLLFLTLTLYDEFCCIHFLYYEVFKLK